MSQKREFRTIQLTELRAADDGNAITGYAAVFDSPSEDLGGFTETINPKAFERCLSANPDIRALVNHDTGRVLGRTKSGTLKLSVDSRGLKMDCALPDTNDGRDIRELVKRGDVSGMSFGFCAMDETWNYSKNADGNESATRELLDCEVFEVSVVAFPAYPMTSVAARALWPDGTPELVETRGKQTTQQTDSKADEARAAAEKLAETRNEAKRTLAKRRLQIRRKK
jgi:uncharacterized protein